MLDEQGFLEKGLRCKKCGAILNKDGRSPAELYGGTYTGLCYKCERAGVYEISKRRDRSVRFMSHPPHCPSWRRDRELFIWVPGCNKCDHGRIMIFRSAGFGGSYPKQCEACKKESIRRITDGVS